MELKADAKQGELMAAVEPVVDRLHRTYKAAQEARSVATAKHDKAGADTAQDQLDALRLFQRDMSEFQRLSVEKIKREWLRELLEAKFTRERSDASEFAHHWKQRSERVKLAGLSATTIPQHAASRLHEMQADWPFTRRPHAGCLRRVLPLRPLRPRLDSRQDGSRGTTEGCHHSEGEFAR